MLLENVDRFEEIPEVYGAFPLREDFLEAGNAALKKFGVEARIVDNVIHIPFTDRLLFSSEDPADNGIEEDDGYMKDWRMRVDACISLNGDPEEGIREVWCEYMVVMPNNENNREFDDYYEPRTEEYDRGYDLIEAFLDRAVDAA
jgi:hypothetical protein